MELVSDTSSSSDRSNVSLSSSEESELELEASLDSERTEIQILNLDILNGDEDDVHESDDQNSSPINFNPRRVPSSRPLSQQANRVVQNVSTDVTKK